MYFNQPVLSEKLSRNRYQTEYLQKFCNDSKSVLYGHRQVPEHVWLEKRPVGSPSSRVDEIPPPTYVRPPFASRLGYYDRIDSRREGSDQLEGDKSYEGTNSCQKKPMAVYRRCMTARPKQSTNQISYTSRPVTVRGRRTGAEHGFEAISKMTLKKYREENYENMIGPRVFFRPTIPARRYDYVIHPSFHSETRKERQVQGGDKQRFSANVVDRRDSRENIGNK